MDTSDWLTYENEEVGYQIQYPSDWQTQTSQSDGVSIYCEEGEWPDCAWSLTINRTDNSLEEFISNYTEKVSAADQQFVKITKQESMNICSVPAQKLRGTTALGIDIINIFIPLNSYAIVLSYPDVRGYTPIGAKVISSFTLISNTANGTPVWQTYSDIARSYSIQYPTTYTKMVQVTVKPEKTILMEKDGTDPILIWSIPNSTNEMPDTWWESEPVGDIKLNGIPGKKFIYQICDGPGCTSDIVNYTIVANARTYALEFYGDKKIDSKEQNIINSFKILNTSSQ